MKRLSIRICVTFILMSGLVLLSACETGPVSKPGLYVNEEYRFTVTYPETWIRKTPSAPDQLYRAADPSGTPEFVARTVDIPKDTALKDFPKVWLELFLKRYFPKTTGHKIVHDKMITLEDGTKAVEYDLIWNLDLPPVKLITTCVAVYRGNKFILICSTGMAAMPGVLEKQKQVTHSLKFYK